MYQDPYQTYSNGWYYYPTETAYRQNNYPMYSNQGGNWGYPMYTDASYMPYQQQQPFMNSYNYPGYTETGEQTASFDASSIPKGVMGYFQNEEGQLDFDKMMSTTGQVVKTMQQVSPIVKGLGSFVKGFK
ncbi:YppG family protein [Halobacillus sp. KGW1]|uniref:YppG family protein n=1 Tax=Halobacillus sp. KGW1 TaxID=1793726 RepID=UPI000786281B|nr:YppG family protein [Halobacillus sp. KGW1]